MKTKQPVIRADGSCELCSTSGGWQCAFHSQEGVRRDREQAKVIALAVRGIRANELGRICARYELESDEFQTREQKAEAILRRQSH